MNRSRTIVVLPVLIAVLALLGGFRALAAPEDTGGSIIYKPANSPESVARLDGSTKTGPSSVMIGERITYTIVLSNSGNLAATGAVFTDPIPFGTTYVPGVTASSGTPGFDGTNVTWTGNIAAGSIVTISFAVDTGGASCGPLLNSAIVDAPGAFTPVTVQHSTQLWDSPAFVTDFESDNGGFVANTPPGEWAWGVLTPTTNSPPAAHSGTRLWATNLRGNITAQPSNHHLTRTISLPQFTDGELRWWDWWDEDSSDDQGRILINGAEAYLIEADQHSWQRHTIDLTPWKGQSVDIAFHYLASGSGNGGAGWYLDDVAILTCVRPIIEVEPTILEQAQFSDVQATIPLTISNMGDASLNWSLVEEAGTQANQAGPVAPGEDSVVVRENVNDASSWNQPSDKVEAGSVRSWKSSTAILHDNGPLVNSPGTGAGGADESRVQDELNLTVLGFDNRASAGFRIADDLTINDPGGWQIDAITFFAYQTGAPTSGTITAVNLQIWDGPPNGGGRVIWGDTTTNVMVSTGWSNIYRVRHDESGNTDRAIMANVVQVGGLILPPGTYWLDWQADGPASYSGPWAPPVTINGQATTGNALLWTGSWDPATDPGSGTQQGFPFIVEGFPAPNCTLSEVSWLNVAPNSGTVPASSNQVINVTLDSTGLVTGLYTGTLCFTSNDQLHRVWRVPVSLKVRGVYLPVVVKGAAIPLAKPESSAKPQPARPMALLPAAVALGLIPYWRSRRRMGVRPQ